MTRANTRSVSVRKTAGAKDRPITKTQRGELEPLLRRTGMPDVAEYFEGLTSRDADWLITELAYPQFRKHDGEWTVIGPLEHIRVGTVEVHKKDLSQTSVQVKRLGNKFTHLGREMVRGFIK